MDYLKEKIMAVIEYNRQLQKKARELNTRAGTQVFKVFSRGEWREFLAPLLNGARSVLEIADFECLQLAELDPGLVQKVLFENPETMEIDGVSLKIEYGKEYWGGNLYARTTVSEEFVRSTDAEGIVLPGGRHVEIRLNSLSSTSFKDLVEKLERERISQAWYQAQGRYQTNYTCDIKTVMGWLEKAGLSLEVARSDNGQGEPILGYFAIKQYSRDSLEWQFFLATSQEEAIEATQKSLQGLLKAASKAGTAIPQEAPWQSKNSGWCSGWSLTQMGQALQTKFEQLLVEYSQECNAQNFDEKLVQLIAACERAKDEIGGEHLEAKQLIETAKTEIEEKSHLREYGAAADEMSSAVNDVETAQYALNRGDYKDVRYLVSKIGNKIKNAEQKIAEFSRLKELMGEVPERLLDTFGSHEKAYAFMKKVQALPHHLLDEHVVGNCGRARVREHLTEISSDDDFFLGADPNDVKWYVNQYHFCGGWEEQQTNEKNLEEEQSEEASQGSSFTYTGDRYFQCSCGCQERMVKGDWVRYKGGMQVQLTCTSCGFTLEFDNELVKP